MPSFQEVTEQMEMDRPASDRVHESTPHRQPTFIEPPGRWPGFGLEELWRYRSVAEKLAIRNLKARYRQTLVGVGWILLQPLALMVVLSVAFTFIGRGEIYGVPFPVFFITGLAIWGPTFKIFNEGATSIVANQTLVTRVYLPRPLIPYSVALSSLVDLGFTLIAMEIVLLLFGYLPSLTYLALPYFILVAYVTMLGIAYFLAAVNVAYRDVQVALPFMDRLAFFASPLLYPVQLVPEELWPIYYLNPLALVLAGFRWALLDLPSPPAYAYVEGSVMAALTLVGGFIYFRKRQPSFADLL